jgi:transposase
MAHLTEEIVVTARKRYASQTATIEQMAKEYMVSYETLRRAIHGLTWAWLKEEAYEAEQKEIAQARQDMEAAMRDFAAQNPDLVKKGE